MTTANCANNPKIPEVTSVIEPAKTADYAITTSDSGKVVMVNPTTVDLTITLPALSATIDGFVVTVINISTNATYYVNVITSTSEDRINGATGSTIRTNTTNKMMVFVASAMGWTLFENNNGCIPRGVFGGGLEVTHVNVLEYITISSTSNVVDFGDLTLARNYPKACSSVTRGVFSGGNTSGPNVNTLDYITISSNGNATKFGELAVKTYGNTGCSSIVRGVWGGGYTTGAVNTIEYVTFATTGNPSAFGSLTVSRYETAACASPTRGIFIGGGNGAGTQYNTMDYITIASAPTCEDFGDLDGVRYMASGCSSTTRGVFGGGSYDGTPRFNTILYITLSTTPPATASSFGELNSVRHAVAASSSITRGIFAGGYNGSTILINSIDYVTIASATNANDFGDLSAARAIFSACSNCHGGLG